MWIWSVVPGEPIDKQNITDLSDYVDQTGINSELDSLEPNLVLWLDGSNIDSQLNASLSDGSVVQQWKDLSGKGSHVTQSTNAKFNAGRNAMVFDGNDQFLASSAFPYKISPPHIFL